ncbi:hypothetical protein DLAC_01135 [Tieghemostelium lacteum]|uniref:Glutathione S-transferase n=1 Tax=Tieghemostelium lacteum TaxID=361077 RepID=A0A152A7T8_TIELA|nr:hypothetical protein DLAC_01135 [Tieghemostelium lacteum]|eukprot:KYR02303.1 hypothetical protein DLAC_01135 [Tieghemostelium lacteum]
MSKITIWGDLMSQPTRMVVWVCKYNNISYDFNVVKIGLKEQRTPEYLKINPFGMVPAIQDNSNNFHLYESHTICRFLLNKYGDQHNLYSSNDIFQRAKIDEYLDWHHTGLRYTFHHYFHEAYLHPKFNEPIDFPLFDKTSNDIPKVLNQFQSLFLKNGQNQFVAGTNSVTLADFSAFCEISQLKLLKFDYTKYQHIHEWMQRMEKLTGYEDVFKFVIKLSKEEPNYLETIKRP